MKIVFMGTPEFALPSLQKIFESNHDLIAVVTAPDKQRGRGREVTPTPVKEFALKNKIKVFTPEKLGDQTFINEMQNMQPDLFVIVAFRILPRAVFSIPRFGSFNLHGSLLPKYRGAAPIQWALIKGEKETGVTTFFLDEKIDTGNIILQEKIQIDDEDNFGTLHDKMMILGAELVLKTVALINTGTFQLSKQDDSLATPAPKITKEICKIDWNKSAIEIHNLARGLSPYPGAFFTYDEKIFKIFKTRVTENVEIKTANSEIKIDSIHSVYQSKKELFIQTGNGLLQILEIQPEGRKKMSVEEFLRGYEF